MPVIEDYLTDEQALGDAMAGVAAWRRGQRCQLRGRLRVIPGVHLVYEDDTDRGLLPDDLLGDESARCTTDISPLNTSAGNSDWWALWRLRWRHKEMQKRLLFVKKKKSQLSQTSVGQSSQSDI
jgi:hypothetical protein